MKKKLLLIVLANIFCVFAAEGFWRFGIWNTGSKSGIICKEDDLIFSEGIAVVEQKDGTKKIIDRNKKVLGTLPKEIICVGEFCDGYAYALKSGVVKKNAEWKWKHTFRREPGYAVAEEGALCGVIDKTGKTVIPFEVWDVIRYSEELFCVLDNETELYGYKNAKNEWVIEPRYFRASLFKDGKATVIFDIYDMHNAVWATIDRNGKYLNAWLENDET